MLTMVLGGLWHGAAWTFVLWGAFHGVCLTAEHLGRGRVRLPGWLGWLVTFHLVVLGWVLFRSQDLGLAGDFLARLVAGGSATLWTVPAVGAVLLVIGLQLVPPRPLDGMRLRVERLHPALLGAGLAVLIAFVGATVLAQGVPPFIYFRF